LGSIKATVLNAKNGVITEERFQKMTLAQWLFHYQEVMMFKDEQVKVIKVIVDRVLDQLELVGTMANPPAGKALQEAKELAKARKQLDADNFAKFFEELKTKIPNKLMIKRKDPLMHRYILPKYEGPERKNKNQQGIVMKQNGGENNGAR
jgi:hypothetical protein